MEISTKNIDLVKHLEVIYSCIPSIHEIRCFDRQQRAIFEGKEIVKIIDGGMAISFAKTHQEAHKDILQHFNDIEPHNIYVVLNKVADNFFLETKPRKVGVALKKISKICTSKNDVMSINSVVIDLDRAETREKDGVKLCASQEELDEINIARINLVDFLAGKNLMPNTQIMSGNGYQVAYYFPSQTEVETATKTIEAFLGKLKIKFPSVSVDQKVKDPSRVTRIAGAWNIKSSRKEIPEEGRIYRRAMLIETSSALNDFSSLQNVIDAIPNEKTISIPAPAKAPAQKKTQKKENADSEEIDEALRRVSLLDVLSKYFTIEKESKHGSKTILCCPFHNDKSPSAWISPNANGIEMLHCSSCKFTAKTALHILQECGNLSFPDALREIGVEPKEQVQDQEETPKKGKKPRRVRLQEYLEKFEELNYHFSMNVLTDDLYINGKRAQDSDLSRLRVAIREWGIVAKKGVDLAQVNDIMVMTASEKSFNPIKDYLDGLQAWDGVDRIDEILKSFPSAAFTAKRWLEIWFAGAVRRIYENGKHFPSLVLTSKKQGVGKSTFSKWLCPKKLQEELFIESPIRPDEKDHRLRISSAWIWEIDELGATTRKADVESLKAFLSTEQIRDRKPYGRLDIVKPAVTAFIGTVNDNGGGFLVDTTGNRRFMIVDANAMTFDFQAIDIDQVWAQAIVLYKQDKYLLNAEDKELQENENKEKVVSTPIEAYLENNFQITQNPDDFVALADIATLLKSKGINQDRKLSMDIASYFNNIEGVEKTRGTIDGKQVRGYSGLKKSYLYSDVEGGNYTPYGDRY